MNRHLDFLLTNDQQVRAEFVLYRAAGHHSSRSADFAAYLETNHSPQYARVEQIPLSTHLYINSSTYTYSSEISERKRASVTFTSYIQYHPKPAASTIAYGRILFFTSYMSRPVAYIESYVKLREERQMSIISITQISAKHFVFVSDSFIRPVALGPVPRSTSEFCVLLFD